MRDAVRLAAVQRGEVHRHALGREMRDQTKHLRHRVLLRRVRGAGEVRAVAEDRVDHPHARVPRPDLDEHADAVAVRGLDHRGHVDRL